MIWHFIATVVFIRSYNFELVVFFSSLMNERTNKKWKKIMILSQEVLLQLDLLIKVVKNFLVEWHTLMINRSRINIVSNHLHCKVNQMTHSFMVRRYSYSHSDSSNPPKINYTQYIDADDFSSEIVHNRQKMRTFVFSLLLHTISTNAL